ncbi:MAG: 4-hydroxybenzoate polyprenyltransferase [Candidatus Latescibacterota bacterium]|jgi:4-hydroxybenzoate polyprenyltransferase
MSLFETVSTYGRMIRFSHSVFALPFAFSGAALAAAQGGISVEQIAWIVVAMVGARSAAMGFNRLADRQYDADNPRTAQRELPSGLVSPLAVVLFVFISSAALVVAAWQLNSLCLYLSPFVLAVLFFYSLTKRFTWASHLVLGLSLGGAPLGAWIAVTGSFALPPFLLCAAVLTWVAGFDIIYSCQDRDYDVDVGLHSIPARFGVQRALHIARVMHVASVLVMVVLGWHVALGAFYWFGVLAIATLLIWEHRLVRPDDLARVNMAFLNLNAVISVVYFVCTLADLVFFGEGKPLLIWPENNP